MNEVLDRAHSVRTGRNRERKSTIFRSRKSGRVTTSNSPYSARAFRWGF